MILFYDKRNGNVFSQIAGRVHPPEMIEVFMIEPSDIPKKDIGKYIVPFKEIHKSINEPVTELRVTNRRTGKVEKVVTGTKRVQQSQGMVPDVPFADLIMALEEGKEDYKNVKIVEKNNTVVAIQKKN